MRIAHTSPHSVAAVRDIEKSLITANLESKTGFPSSHQLRSYVASKSRLKLAARCPVSGCWPSCLIYLYVFLLSVSRTSLKWSVLCRVGCKTLTSNQSLAVCSLFIFRLQFHCSSTQSWRFCCWMTTRSWTFLLTALDRTAGLVVLVSSTAASNW